MNTFNEVQTTLEYLIIQLTSLKASPGPHLKKFRQSLQSNKFKDIEFVFASNSQEDAAYCQELTIAILDETLKYISERFSEFVEADLWLLTLLLSIHVCGLLITNT